MYEFYGNSQLDKDDITAIDYLYGVRPTFITTHLSTTIEYPLVTIPTKRQMKNTHKKIHVILILSILIYNTQVVVKIQDTTMKIFLNLSY